METPVDNLRGTTEPNWDSYEARALTPEVIELADSIYRNIAFVPTTNGGFQVEFHCGGFDVEIEIDSQRRLAGVYIEREERE